MFSFSTLLSVLKGRGILTGRSLKMTLWSFGLQIPQDVTGMYLRGESMEYILAASLVVSQGAGE